MRLTLKKQANPKGYLNCPSALNLGSDVTLGIVEQVVKCVVCRRMLSHTITMADVQYAQANGISRKRKVVLRLDDGSLIGPVETLLGTGSHGADAVLLDFEAACRTGKAGRPELDRLERLINDFQSRISGGIMSIPRNELKQRNPYIQDVSGRPLPACVWGFGGGPAAYMSLLVLCQKHSSSWQPPPVMQLPIMHIPVMHALLQQSLSA